MAGSDQSKNHISQEYLVRIQSQQSKKINAPTASGTLRENQIRIKDDTTVILGAAEHRQKKMTAPTLATQAWKQQMNNFSAQMINPNLASVSRHKSEPFAMPVQNLTKTAGFYNVDSVTALIGDKQNETGITSNASKTWANQESVMAGIPAKTHHGTSVVVPNQTNLMQAVHLKSLAPQLSIRNRRLNKLERKKEAAYATLHSN